MDIWRDRRISRNSGLEGKNLFLSLHLSTWQGCQLPTTLQTFLSVMILQGILCKPIFLAIQQASDGQTAEQQKKAQQLEDRGAQLDCELKLLLQAST